MPLGLQTITFTATSASYTSATKVSAEPDTVGPPDRTIRLFAATAATTTGTAIARLSLVDNDRVPSADRRVYYAEAVTITHSTSNARAGIDGASGDYICTVSCASSSLDRADLMGSARSGGMKDLEWRIGLTAAAMSVSSTTPLLVYVGFDNEV